MPPPSGAAMADADAWRYPRRQFDQKSSSGPQLFPLPSLPLPEDYGGISKYAERRRCKKVVIWREVNDAISALNLLYGCCHEAPARTCSSSLSVLHADVHRRLIQRVATLRPEKVPSPTGAAQEVLGSCYDYMGSSCTVEPYNAETVSLPSALIPAVEVCSLLSDETRAALTLDRMLADADVVAWRREAGAVVPYLDATFKASPGRFMQFVTRLFDIGIMGVTDNCRQRVTPFFVGKKGGKQRMVLDCRTVNELFRSPPTPDLGSAECFSRVGTAERSAQAPPPEPTERLGAGEEYKPRPVYFADADIKNCFYQCGMPPSWSDFFVLIEIPRDFLRARGITKLISGADLPATGPLYAALLVLPMGWSWSFYIVQNLHEKLIGEVGFPASRCQASKWPTPDLVEGPVAQPYCDNLQVLGYSKPEVDEALVKIMDHFRAKGFELHEEEFGRTKAEPLGCLIDGERHLCGPKPVRAWRLRQTFMWLSRGPVVTGRQVEKIIGHYIADGMHRRESLSVLRALYDFIRACYWVPTRLWESCRTEAYIAGSILPLCYNDFSKGWTEKVTAVDSSLWGWGACTTTLPATTVASLGAWTETWRYRRLPPEEWAPRRRLDLTTDQPDVFDDIGTALSPPVLPDTDIPRPTELDWEWRAGFPDPPDIRKWDWDISDWGKWRFKEHITQLEGRALVTHLSHLVLDRDAHNRETLVFVDSFSTACAMSKGRGQDIGMLQSTRRVAALCFACNIGLHVRWVPSEWNVADEPSRYFETVDGVFRPALFAKEYGPGGPSKDSSRSRDRNAWWEHRRATAEARLAETSRASGLTETAGTARYASSSAPKVWSQPCIKAFDHRSRGSRVSEAVEAHGPRVEVGASGHPAIVWPVRCRVPEVAKGATPEESHRCGAPRVHRPPPGLQHPDEGDRGISECSTVLRLQLATLLAPPAEGGARSAAHASTPVSDSLGGGDCGRDRGDPDRVEPQTICLARAIVDFRLLAAGRGTSASGRGCAEALEGPSKVVAVLESLPGTTGERASDEDGSVRRNDLPRSPSRPRRGDRRVRVAVPSDVTSVPVSGGHDPSSVEGGSGRGRSGRRRPISATALGGERGSAGGAANVAGHRGARSVADIGQRQEIRKVGASAKESGKAQQVSDGVCLRCASPARAPVAGHLETKARPRAGAQQKPPKDPAGFEHMYFEGEKFWGQGEAATSTHGFLHRRSPRGKAAPAKRVVELFGGLCGISRSVAHRGGSAESFEILRDAREDLNRRSQRRSLFARVRAGGVESLWIGITCASWSRARRAPPGSRMPCALRDDDKYILGLPGLSDKDQAKVNDGNQSLDFLCSLIDLCLRHGVMLVVENPCTSRLWVAPAMASRIAKAATSQNVDYCSFGERWRKRTRLIAWGRGLYGLPPLCSSTGGICSYSGAPHELLSGFGKGGAFKTAIASPYPRRFCQLVAPQLMSAPKIGRKQRA